MTNKIVIIFILFTVSFIQPNSKPKIKSGAIFGKVVYIEAKNTKPVIITIMGTDKIAQADSEGYFYINNLKPGLYNLEIQMEDLNVRCAEGINVMSGKITCLGTVNINQSLVGEKLWWWGIIEYQKKVEPVKYGSIEGYILDEDGKPVPNALITYNDDKYPWDGKSDSAGYFKINKVIPGYYPGISVLNWGTEYIGIKVIPKHTTRVRLEVFESIKEIEIF
jgi:hypothetical protein